MAIFYIVVLIGSLVFIHEMGHYLAARLFHVKVLSFSVGFGPKIFGFHKFGNDWDIRLLPLGGYVQMLGSETDNSEPEEEEKNVSYTYKPIWQKAVINLAGPLFNLLLPLPILFFSYAANVDEVLPPVIGQILDNTPAAEAELREGDVVTKINDTEIKYWHQLQNIVSKAENEKLRFTVLRNDKEIQLGITPKRYALRDNMDIMTENIGRIGITPDSSPPVIGIDDSQSPAAVAGLRSFDEIVAINGKIVKTYADIENILLHAKQNTHTFLLLRPVDLNIPHIPVSRLAPVEINITIDAFDSLDKLGIAPANMFLTQVDPDSPAAEAGLKTGDHIVELDGKSVNIFRTFVSDLNQDWENEHRIAYLRDGQRFETTLKLKKINLIGEFQEEIPTIYAGFYNRLPTVIPDLVSMPTSDRILFAAKESVAVTVKASTLLVVYIARMIQGRVSTKSLGGPIMIGHMASKAGEQGLDAFLRMMAFISINLGIINLMPIPLFDGGKLVILAAEAVKRGPLSMRTREIIAYVGFAAIILLMLIAFKNDFERYWHLVF